MIREYMKHDRFAIVPILLKQILGVSPLPMTTIDCESVLKSPATSILKAAKWLNINAGLRVKVSRGLGSAAPSELNYKTP
jgi:hypothetical protein